MSHKDVTLEAELERLDGNLVRGRVGESSRLYRLQVGGQWYFCKASDFDDSKRAEAFLRHVTVPARVTLAPYVVNGRRRIGWLRVPASGETLPPANPFRMAGMALLSGLIGVALCLALYFGWHWVSQWPTLGFVIAVPVLLVLAGVAAFCLFGAVAMAMETANRFRPRRVRAFFTYRRLYAGTKA